MAEFSNPTKKLTSTKVPDDVWAVAEFAVKSTISNYVLEDVVWHLRKSAGGHYIMIIRVTGAVPSNMFGVTVHKDAETGKLTKELFNPIFTPMAYN